MSNISNVDHMIEQVLEGIDPSKVILTESPFKSDKSINIFAGFDREDDTNYNKVLEILEKNSISLRHGKYRFNKSYSDENPFNTMKLFFPDRIVTKLALDALRKENAIELVLDHSKLDPDIKELDKLNNAWRKNWDKYHIHQTSTLKPEFKNKSEKEINTLMGKDKYRDKIKEIQSNYTDGKYNMS